MKAGAMEANRDQAVGVIGLGYMGSGVAARLVEVEFPVLGFDISEERNNQAAGQKASSLPKGWPM